MSTPLGVMVAAQYAQMLVVYFIDMTAEIGPRAV